LEFIVVILQLIAAVIRLASLSASDRHAVFPDGLPTMPVLLCLTDNSSAKAWANRVTTKSPQGQHLIGIYAEILRTYNIGLNYDHIAGVENEMADFISRPTHFNLPHSERAEQIFQKYAFMRTWDYFLPSPEILQLLASLLFTEVSQDHPRLPANFGRFVPTGSTISSSQSL
jgi:hypothetical protein